MKHTAVDWLYNNLKSHFEHDGDLLECVQMSMQQAKEIEKQEQEKLGIILAIFADEIGDSRFVELLEKAKQYYNETFKSE